MTGDAYSIRVPIPPRLLRGTRIKYASPILVLARKRPQVFPMSFPTDPHLQALEAASMSAWPGLRAVPLGGWLLRFGDGHTKRANCLTLLRAEGGDPAARLAQSEALFADAVMTPCVRFSDFADAPTLQALDDAGYAEPFDTTVTLWRPLEASDDLPVGAEIIAGAPSAEWLDDKDRINADLPADAAARRKILAAIAVPVAYAGVRGPDGRYGAVAYVAVDSGIASLNMVATDPVLRGRRMAELACAGLLAWARDKAGAREACLQVVEANDPARRLYARMGFGDPLYRYQYRLKAAVR